MIGGLRYYINPALGTGTAILHAPETLHAWLEVDSSETVQRIVDALNEHERDFNAWLDRDFLQSCGIDIRTGTSH